MQTLPQAKARFQLNARHQLVSALRNALPFLKGGRNVEQEATDAGHQHSIEALFADVISALVAYNARARPLFAPLPRNRETPLYVLKVLAHFERD